ncbi:phosphatase [Cryptococcus neoformans]|uniref:Phosphatase n=2 Tax=Cryptococcus neoformans TaxID=5207 RepID=A0A854QBM9_CRYNE|nr:phosphatase [Cryptococcus neoformans var. grubii H99]AUB25849.1 phosphatase [Cryptococcus neoformans var. grubii]OWT38943.1 phosphatase [Cryptococcus neoformans var. grubii Bt1]OWZ30823.1 phosphatase [Cryptococcus neoformans var. grubii AD2-60a]OWZ39690.1 phosphatase [Cryptococcus neoformans var. grubii AD1-83a]OWZ43055.1 phosphatase [Cryptococcus neoformans var. grubii C23]OWZ53712.1 phosphatase [Cryptococcus neoformans var. grubii 125.91]OWZ77468.1 phosphatase [Cryptococcus neoformans v|eukprot:XP_012050786.1 phosphatase [Cryptococcus neoformans var. grubii H99]
MARETLSSTGIRYNETTVFTADGVLFDMDGTLTDSIAAVEAAWTAKAEEFGLEPEAVIKATHGRRASDNLQDLIPNLRKEHVDREVEKFEQSILAFADTPPRSRRSSSASSTRTSRSGSRSMSGSMGSLAPFTPMSSCTPAATKPFNTGEALNLTSFKLRESGGLEPQLDDSVFEDEVDDLIDMSVRILPGVRSLINSLPQDKYAIATSGAKTYCHGCLNRTGISIPKVCVTADDPRLLRGKPFPDPFLLAAADLGIDPTRAVIFEDSPSGIKAAVAAGATVIAVCTSHQRHQIEHLDAHFVIDTMDQIKVVQGKDGQLEFTVTY